MIEIRWHGRGGQGAFTAARLLGLSASLFAGKFAMAFPSFGPERRGAPVLAFTKISESKIYDRSEIKICDYIVVLDHTLFQEKMLNDLKPGGVIFINSDQAPKAFSVNHAEQIVTFDGTTAALNVLGKPITNTAMLGALIGYTSVISQEAIVQGIGREMKPSLVAKNIELVRLAYTSVETGCNT